MLGILKLALILYHLMYDLFESWSLWVYKAATIFIFMYVCLLLFVVAI